MTVKDLTSFKENENINGIKEKFLIIDCCHCPEKEKNFNSSQKCKFCYLSSLFKNKDRKFNYISILWKEVLIKPSQFYMFLNYFKFSKKIKRINQNIESIRVKKCKYKEFACKILPNFPSLYKIKDYEYLDPILVYDVILKRYASYKKRIKIVDSICKKCFSYIEKSENFLLKLFSDLTIIKEFKNFQNNHISSQNYDSFYEYLFSGRATLTKKDIKNKSLVFKKNWELFNTYKTGENELFNVSIYNVSNENEKRYALNFFFKGKVNEDYFYKIIQTVLNNIEIEDFDKLIPLETLIEIYKKESIKFINSKFELSKYVKNKIGFIAALKKLNFDKLFPLLIDDFIEEIFLDSPNDEVYINHQIYGRCRTDLKFNSREIERIKTFFRLYSGKRLDFMNPTIKFVMKNKFFYCRFSIDVEPIQINNLALDIRKLNKNILTIQDLLKNGTLSSLIAAFLYFNILRRKNITVTGETDTGKTTLINAFDLLTPKEFRKIYIENVIESLNQLVYGKHQLKYKVDSLEGSIEEKYSKSNQIKTLLHRTPDIIYLGEILTKEEAKAMFHCLAAGLRGFQTIHSKNIDSLINRFLYHFKIDRSCLNDLDLIVLMKKDFNKRKVIGVFEVYRSTDVTNKIYYPLFKYNPENQKWVLTKSLYETNAIKELINYENLPEDKFSSLIKTYNEIFEFISKVDRIDNIELIEFFHKISYHSFISLKSLVSYWKEWKKNRSLNF